ncbi:MAG: V-type ATP synthase subunit D, partial [Fibrobacter sp.]|nr:V-type ATP synthase subunit D [Fibrobacter sp.]
MATTLLTKNELKKQRDILRLYSRYLPTLQLKKQQIQTVLRSIEDTLSKKERFGEIKLSEISEWVSVLAENTPLEEYIEVAHVIKEKKTVAGVEVPVFVSVTFVDHHYDLFNTPFWIDSAIQAIKVLITNKI